MLFETAILLSLLAAILLVTGCVTAQKAKAPAEKDLAAYLLVYFKDQDHSLYFALSSDGYTFTDVNNFDLENSFGQTSLTGTVTGSYQIAAVSTTCNYSNWALLADQAATTAGAGRRCCLPPRRGADRSARRQRR